MSRFRPVHEDVRSISAERLLLGHALSPSNQPHLSDLIEYISQPENPVTIFVGAGFSIDSGFPNWGRLLELVAEKIQRDDFRQLALDDGDDPLRHAETLLRLISPSSSSTDADIVRDALYASAPSATEPGPLAQSLATLCACGPGRFSVITTNFDDVIESALAEEFDEDDISAFSLNGVHDDGTRCGVDEWRAAREEFGARAVLHLHGMTRRQMTPLQPVILTESHFLRHGPAVRKIIFDELVERCVIFIGVSLTDPNVVGPLWDRAEEIQRTGRKLPPCFVLHVPGPVEGADSLKTSYAYTLSKYRYFELALGVKPVFLKSFSQLHQLMSELSVSHLVQIKAESSATTEERQSYGVRFGNKLRSAYETLGYDHSGKNIAHDAALRVSEALRRELAPGSSLGSMLYEADYEIRAKHQELVGSTPGMQETVGSTPGIQERFGLFLWLRVPETHNGDPAPYAIRLVGASPYTHYEEWSFTRDVVIEADSLYPPSTAVFSGMAVAMNLKATSEFQLWRSAIAVPVRVEGDRYEREDGTSIADSMTVGAVVLNSNKMTVLGETADTGVDAVGRNSGVHELSILAAYTQRADVINTLIQAIEEAAKSVINS
ncbi:MULTISPECIES: SIR2 family protein [unclassified Gordonia (in: high G+C Gram-positive bacteria)]|uniref:SIR2 family protein n=1 Tax=unclassified Gordonia (in: high G+C Gram-positive bacteria) TaxID=2657482 RepID=UPI0008158583|nr:MULTISPECIES: SIR2 family protein [unclassified Gordonia (in: high G+C Gram-positive bacteria)]SCC56050.1 SIR2-like domain-containing protein [Gordonia sp. v-85]